jgi:hypothetical protein
MNCPVVTQAEAALGSPNRATPGPTQRLVTSPAPTATRAPSTLVVLPLAFVFDRNRRGAPLLLAPHLPLTLATRGFPSSQQTRSHSLPSRHATAGGEGACSKPYTLPASNAAALAVLRRRRPADAAAGPGGGPPVVGGRGARAPRGGGGAGRGPAGARQARGARRGRGVAGGPEDLGESARRAEAVRLRHAHGGDGGHGAQRRWDPRRRERRLARSPLSPSPALGPNVFFFELFFWFASRPFLFLFFFSVAVYLVQ